MVRRMIDALYRALCIAGLCVGATSALAREPAVVVFGDSLSDSGNEFAITGQLNVPPYDQLDASRIPDFPYAISAGRFTNGRTWVEDAARAAGIQSDVRAALRARRPGTNYAYGSARAGAPLLPSDARDLTEQVTTYLADVNGSADGDFIVMFIGANDVADAVRALAVDPSGATSIDGLLTGIGSVNANIGALMAAGARHFLILNIPNLGLVPALNPPLAPPGVSGIATCWTLLFNHGTPLPDGCPNLPPGIPGLDDIAAGLATQEGVYVKLIDTFSFINQIAADPARVGITNMTDTCVTPNIAPYQCTRPSRYFFWDGIHPTRAVHQLLADEVLRQLETD
jgi:phospholipase/lecithinase/hemolysin